MATILAESLYAKAVGKEQSKFLYGAGCKACANTGYRGRTGIFELLVMSEEIRAMLLRNASAGDIKAEALREGMVTMKREGMLKAKEGITSISEVLRRVFSIG